MRRPPRARGGTTREDVPYDATRYITPRSLFSGTMAEAVGALQPPIEEPTKPRPEAPVPAPTRAPAAGSDTSDDAEEA